MEIFIQTIFINDDKLKQLNPLVTISHDDTNITHIPSCVSYVFLSQIILYLIIIRFCLISSNNNYVILSNLFDNIVILYD